MLWALKLRWILGGIYLIKLWNMQRGWCWWWGSGRWGSIWEQFWGCRMIFLVFQNLFCVNYALNICVRLSVYWIILCTCVCLFWSVISKYSALYFCTFWLSEYCFLLSPGTLFLHEVLCLAYFAAKKGEKMVYLYSICVCVFCIYFADLPDMPVFCCCIYFYV